MNIAFIGCSVMDREINYEISRSPNTCMTCLLPQDLHNTPELLNKKLQEQIDLIEEEQLNLPAEKRYDFICIGYGLCSKGVVGLKSKSISLIVPRCDDCISLFLGSASRYNDMFAKNPGTYWYNSGWIENAFTPSEESYNELLNKYIKEYGQENAEYLMETEMGFSKKYSRCVFIDSPIQQNPEHLSYVEQASRYLNWDLAIVKGDMSFFHQLINGPWTEDRFLICPPKHLIIRAYNDNKIDVEAAETDKSDPIGLTTFREKSDV